MFILSTHNIVHPCLDVLIIKYGADISSYMQLKKSRQQIKINPIWIYDADHEYIWDNIMRCDHIEYEKYIQKDDN